MRLERSRLVTEIEGILEKAGGEQNAPRGVPTTTFDTVARTANEISESMRKEPDDADAYPWRGMADALRVVQEAVILEIEDLCFPKEMMPRCEQNSSGLIGANSSTNSGELRRNGADYLLYLL
jgi:hypothetical protein